MTQQIVLEFDAGELAAGLADWGAARQKAATLEAAGHAVPARVYADVDRAATAIAHLVEAAFERTPGQDRAAPLAQDAPDPLVALERTLCHGKSPTERAHAAIALAAIGSQQAAEILDRGLAVTEIPSVRGAIVCARARIAREAVATLNASVGDVTGLAPENCTSAGMELLAVASREERVR